MNKKVIIITIGFFLAVLFLSTVGSFYTGYAVLGQKDITLKNFPYPFVKNNVPNGLYIVIPYDYTYNEFKAANDLADSLKGMNVLPPSVITPNYLPQGDHNLVLIGNPCNNKLISNELAILDCDLSLKQGEGFIRLINHERTSTLIVSSFRPEDLVKPVIILTNYDFYPLMGKTITIDGEVGNLILNYH